MKPLQYKAGDFTLLHLHIGNIKNFECINKLLGKVLQKK